MVAHLDPLADQKDWVMEVLVLAALETAVAALYLIVREKPLRHQGAASFAFPLPDFRGLACKWAD